MPIGCKMFDSAFNYRYINNQKSMASGIPTTCHNYSFRGKKNKRYIVIAEQFNYMVYAIKFYLQEHKSCEHRFSRLTDEYECSRIIATVGKIMVDIHRKDPFASFVFVGSPIEKEQQKNTKRFRVYSKIVANLVAPVNFEHKTSRNHSAYLMLNRNNQEPNLLPKIEEMFKPIYQYELTHPSQDA